MAKLSKHFGDNEFQCPCCKKICPDGMSPRLVLCLERLRALVGRSIYITSGYRCAVHNKAVGGVPTSLHILGMAADITVPFLDNIKLFELAEKCGFGGLGLYVGRGFVHVDTGKVARWCTAKDGRKLKLEDYVGREGKS